MNIGLMREFGDLEGKQFDYHPVLLRSRYQLQWIPVHCNHPGPSDGHRWLLDALHRFFARTPAAEPDFSGWIPIPKGMST